LFVPNVESRPTLGFIALHKSTRQWVVPIIKISLRLSLCVLAPLTTFGIIRDKFTPKSEIGFNRVLSICFGISSVLYVCFQLLVCWNFIRKICSNLIQSFASFRFVEQLMGVKFDVRLKFAIKFYQVLGILVAFAFCVKFFISFLTTGQAWDLQLLINFTRMQMYVVEQLIVTMSLLFAMCYQQLTKCVANFVIKTQPQVSISFKNSYSKIASM